MPASTRPNVIVYFTDQQRWDTAGCFGSPLNITPHLDALAARGTRLENSITCQPVCGPARSCFQTGKYATQTGVWRNGISLRDDEITLAKVFNEAGYRSCYMGKWHLAENRKDLDRRHGRLASVPPDARGGYQDWYAANILEFYSEPYAYRVQDGSGVDVRRGGYRVDAQTDIMLEYIRDHVQTRGEQPLFLFNSYLEPHHQNDMHRYYGPEGCQERFRNAWSPPDLKDGQGDWQKEWPDYLGCCASLDENLGRLMAELENLGIADNTVILFTSDHGSHFRTRNGEYKRSCHDSSVRVPTVIAGPGFEGGVTVDQQVSLVDWPATLVDAAGLKVPETFVGRSVKALAQAAKSGQAAPAWPEEAFIQISESHIGRAIRTKKWKYSVGSSKDATVADGASSAYDEQFLYDMENDPYEQRNLVASAEHAGVRDELRARLLKRMAEIGEATPEIRAAQA